MDNPRREEMLRQVLELSKQMMTRLPDLPPCVIMSPVEVHYTYLGGTESIN